MKISHATAVWERDLIKGKGFIRSGSGVFQGNYSFASRFEEGKDTNPEELIGAAHAACFPGRSPVESACAAGLAVDC